MPKVRTYESQVANRPVSLGYSDARPSEAAIGGAMGQALEQVGGATQRVGGQLGDMAVRMRQEADDHVFDGASLQLNQVIGEQERGSGIGESKTLGFLNKRGDNALDDSAHRKAIEDAKNKILGSMQSDQQRERFSTWAAQRTQQTYNQFTEHTAREMVNAQADTAKGQMQVAEQDAVAGYENPDLVLGAIDRIKEEKGADGSVRPGILQRTLRAQGVPQVEVDAQEKAYESTVISKAIAQHLDNEDGVAALNFLNYPGIRERLGSAAAGEAEKKIRPVMAKQEAFTYANQAIAASRVKSDGKTPSPWVDDRRARDVVAGIEDETTRKFAQQRVEDLIRQAKDEKKQALDGVYNEGLAAYQKRRMRSDVPASVQDVLTDPENEPKQWEELKRIMDADDERARVRAGQGKHRDATPEEELAKLELRHEFATNPGRFATMDAAAQTKVLAPLAPKDHDFGAAEIQRIQERMRKGKPLDAVAQAEVLRVGRDQKLFGNKPSVSSWTADQQLLYRTASEYVANEEGKFRIANEGKEPDTKTINEWVAFALTKSPVPKSGWFGSDFLPDKRAPIEDWVKGAGIAPNGETKAQGSFDLGANDATEKVEIPGLGSMPKADYARIVSKLRSERPGSKVTHRDVFSAYAAEKGNQ